MQRIARSTSVLLRPVVAADSPALTRCFDDAEVRRYLFDDRSVSASETAVFIARSVASFVSAVYGLSVLIDGVVLIGFAGLIPLEDGRARADLLYGLLPSRWGTGLATHAAHCVVDHGARTRRLKEITASVDVPNRASIALLERLGFEYV